jgi:hypothetical protein
VNTVRAVGAPRHSGRCLAPTRPNEWARPLAEPLARPSWAAPVGRVGQVGTVPPKPTVDSASLADTHFRLEPVHLDATRWARRPFPSRFETCLAARGLRQAQPRGSRSRDQVGSRHWLKEPAHPIRPTAEAHPASRRGRPAGAGACAGAGWPQATPRRLRATPRGDGAILSPRQSNCVPDRPIILLFDDPSDGLDERILIRSALSRICPI